MSSAEDVSHCRDCCCARAWKALGIDSYTGKSIPEHIEEVKLELQLSSQQAGELRDERARLRVAIGNIVSYSLMENSKAMEWIREAARNALAGDAT